MKTEMILHVIKKLITIIFNYKYYWKLYFQFDINSYILNEFNWIMSIILMTLWGVDDDYIFITTF